MMSTNQATMDALQVENTYLRQRVAELEQQPQPDIQLNEAHIQTLIKHIAAAIFIHHNGQFRYANPAAAAMLGYSLEELHTCQFADFVHPDSLSIVEQRAAARQRGESVPAHYEVKIVTKSGEVRWIDTHNSCMLFMGEPVILVTCFDVTERKQMEEALRQNQMLLQGVIDGVPAAIIAKDCTGRYILANVYAAQGVGLTPAQVVGLTDDDLLPPDQAAAATTREQQVLAMGKPVQREITMSLVDGTHTTFVTNFPICDDQGTIYAVGGIGLDITARKQIEEELRESEERFRALFEKSADAIVLLSDEGVIACNQAMVDMLRADSREQLLHTLPTDSSPERQPDGRYSSEKANEMMTKAIEQGYHCFEWVHRRLDGTEIMVEVLLTSIILHGKTILYSVSRDITERKRAEETLRSREAILQAVGFAGEQLIGDTHLAASIPMVLSHLGVATHVDRVYIFENTTTSTGTLVTSQRYEWVAPGIKPCIEDPVLQNLPYLEAGLERWVSLLSQQQTVVGAEYAFPPDERMLLEVQQVQSIAVVPIFVGQQWWGFLGFDTCRHERVWHPAEIDALRAAASLIGSTIQARATEDERAALQQQVIDAQRDALRELSTPLIPISDKVVIMPLIGSIDSVRSQQILETLLTGVTQRQSTLAILDITGVSMVDTQVAQGLVSAAQAVKLLGAQVMLTGIGPQLAQTLVQLSADLGGITTHGSLQAGIAAALGRRAA